MNQTNKTLNKKKKYERLSQEYVKASFDASVSVSVTKQAQWINISLALWNGKAFAVKDQKAMSVALKTQAVQELITALQNALDKQRQEWTRQQEEDLDQTIDLSVTEPLPEDFNPNKWTD